MQRRRGRASGTTARGLRRTSSPVSVLRGVEALRLEQFDERQRAARRTDHAARARLAASRRARRAPHARHARPARRTPARRHARGSPGQSTPRRRRPSRRRSPGCADCRASGTSPRRARPSAPRCRRAHRPPARGRAAEPRRRARRARPKACPAPVRATPRRSRRCPMRPATRRGAPAASRARAAPQPAPDAGGRASTPSTTSVGTGGEPSASQRSRCSLITTDSNSIPMRTKELLGQAADRSAGVRVEDELRHPLDGGTVSTGIMN